MDEELQHSPAVAGLVTCTVPAYLSMATPINLPGMLQGLATVWEPLRIPDRAPRCTAEYGDIFFALLIQLSQLSCEHLPPASICRSSLTRDRWPGEAIPWLWHQSNCTAWCKPQAVQRRGRRPSASNKEHLMQKSLSAAWAGLIRVCYCIFYHHGLLEVHDSVLGICISMLTLAPTSSQCLVPEETCRETCESRYSAAGRFAVASAASGYFYEECRAHTWLQLTISLPG